MPLDARGNFYPVFPGMTPFDSSYAQKVLFVDGVPNNADGNDGEVWANRITGTVYERVNGVWVPRILSGGVGAIAQVLASSFANPNGNVTPGDPSKGAIYYQEPISLLNAWQWSVDNQQWEQFSG